MWEYNYNYSNELYHYGVKGMKWGVRRASKLQSRANTARASADEWDELARRATAKGKMKKAAKYTQAANEDRAVAAKYQQKANAKVEKRYAKAGRAAGAAAYQKDKGKAAYEKHDNAAKVLDKTAKKYDRQGQYIKAEAARKSAAALRARGSNIQAEHNSAADRLLKKSAKLNAKASDFASKSTVSLGKSTVDSILKESKKKGYSNAKANDEAWREIELENRLGSKGYAAYNYARGK